jgi:hypothetical protein
MSEPGLKVLLHAQNYGCGLDCRRPLDERRRKSYAAGSEAQRAAPEQAGPQAGPKLGPLFIVPLHAS